MSEENKDVNSGTEVPGEQKPLTRIQEEALSQGWRPKEEFEGDEDEFIDAAEFVRRGELFRKIESQSRELKDVKKALTGLAQHNSKIREIEYKRALDELKSQKKEALNEGDSDRVVDIDEKIDLVKEQQRQNTQQQIAEAAPQGVHPELAAWIDKNPWYESNKEMQEYADFIGTKLGRQGLSPTDVLKEVEKKVKEQYKDKFRNPNRDKASAVESARGTPRSTKEADIEMTDVEKTVMKTLVDGGHITKEEYIKQLKQVKNK